MKKENDQVSKNTWKRIIKKKWFFPALYLTIAALLLTGVVWFQNANKTTEIQEDFDQLADEFTEQVPYDDEVKAVMEQQETIKMPVKDEKDIEIITKFFDYDADQEDQERALVEYNNRFYQSTGIDLAASDGESFDVVASLSGTVAEVKDDPILGNVVVLSHDEDIKTYYASLQDVAVAEGDELSQGDLIGSAGKNLFGKENGNHVHFELRKTGAEVNPEDFFNQPLSKLATYAMDDVDEDDEDTEETME
ncbi:MAG TPA: M23 family metallopeptidase [Bacillota bacterium]|nr:M23 family metallopeptidase [Bacillota bacterium]